MSEKDPRLPAVVRVLLRIGTPPSLRRELEGDLQEEWRRVRRDEGRGRASLYLVRESFGLEDGARKNLCPNAQDGSLPPRASWGSTDSPPPGRKWDQVLRVWGSRQLVVDDSGGGRDPRSGGRMRSVKIIWTALAVLVLVIGALGFQSPEQSRKDPRPTSPSGEPAVFGLGAGDARPLTRPGGTEITIRDEDRITVRLQLSDSVSSAYESFTAAHVGTAIVIAAGDHRSSPMLVAAPVRTGRVVLRLEAGRAAAFLQALEEAVTGCGERPT